MSVLHPCPAGAVCQKTQNRTFVKTFPRDSLCVLSVLIFQDFSSDDRKMQAVRPIANLAVRNGKCPLFESVMLESSKDVRIICAAPTLAIT